MTMQTMRKLTRAEAGLPEPGETYMQRMRMGLDSKTAKPMPKPVSPLSGALAFITKYREIESVYGWKAARVYLHNRYYDVFGTHPEPGTPLAVMRARVAYRLQGEAHRLSRLPMSRAFAQNYRAVMRFDNSDPFQGCTPTVKQIGGYLIRSEGEATMESVRKAAKVVKKSTAVSVGPATSPATISGITEKIAPKAIKVIKKVAAKPAKKEGKRPKVFGKYSAGQIVLHLRDDLKLAREKALAIMGKVSPATSKITINANWYNGEKRKCEIASEDSQRLKAMAK